MSQFVQREVGKPFVLSSTSFSLWVVVCTEQSTVLNLLLVLVNFVSAEKRLVLLVYCLDTFS